MRVKATPKAMTLADTEVKTGRLAYNRTIGYTAMFGRGLYYPVDFAVGDDGRFYVLNRSSDGDKRGVRITIMDLEEGYYGIFGEFGEGKGQFMWPNSIAIDSAQRLYISDDYMNQISVMSTGGDFIARWGDAGAGEGQLDGPNGLAVDSSDELLVADHRNNRIQRFTGDGEYLGTFGEAGAAEGQFNMPWGVSICPDGDILVADWGNDRIQKLTPEGEFVASYGTPGRGETEIHRPSSACMDDDGYVYVADWGNHRLQVLDPDGGFVQSLRGQATISKWAKAFLDTNVEEAAARARSNLDLPTELFNGDPHEESSHIEKYFWGPSCVRLVSGLVYVVDTVRHRVQVFDVLKSS